MPRKDKGGNSQGARDALTRYKGLAEDALEGLDTPSDNIRDIAARIKTMTAGAELHAGNRTIPDKTKLLVMAFNATGLDRTMKFQDAKIIVESGNIGDNHSEPVKEKLNFMKGLSNGYDAIGGAALIGVRK